MILYTIVFHGCAFCTYVLYSCEVRRERKESMRRNPVKQMKKRRDAIFTIFWRYEQIYFTVQCSVQNRRRQVFFFVVQVDKLCCVHQSCTVPLQGYRVIRSGPFFLNINTIIIVNGLYKSLTKSYHVTVSDLFIDSKKTERYVHCSLFVRFTHHPYRAVCTPETVLIKHEYVK